MTPQPVGLEGSGLTVTPSGRSGPGPDPSDQDITRPPDTLIACPVMKLASRVARKATSAATSAGRAGRRNGIRRRKEFQPSGGTPGGGSDDSLVGPRLTTLTVTLWQATSRASDLENAITAALVPDWAVSMVAPRLADVPRRLRRFLRRRPGRKQEAIFARGMSGARFATARPEERTAPKIGFDLPPGVEEEYQRIRANLLAAPRGTETRAFVVAASLSGEGATTTSVLLGMTLAQDARTILVDGNLRTPALGKVFGTEEGRGFADVLADGTSLATCIRETPVPNLYVLAGGKNTVRLHPALLLRNPRLPEIVRELRERFTYAIFDCAPLNAYSEGVYLAAQVDGVVMVVHAETTPIEVAYRAKVQIERSGPRVLGALLTKKRDYLPEALSRRL